MYTCEGMSKNSIKYNMDIQFTKGDEARAKYGKIKIHQKEVFDKELFFTSVTS
jgi:hypothetical protein